MESCLQSGNSIVLELSQCMVALLLALSDISKPQLFDWKMLFSSEKTAVLTPLQPRSQGLFPICHSLRTQTYFRLSLVPPKITSANSSQRLISVTSKFLCCCWPVKFTDRTWHSRTRASTPREPAIILELEFVRSELWVPSQHRRTY